MDVSPEYDESTWTWPDWEPTPPFEHWLERLLAWLFG
jgi:hypothetical protein